MDFSYSEKTEQLRAQLTNFMDDHIVPRIRPWSEEIHAGTFPVSFMEDLKALAKDEGLWNMFLPHLRDDEPGTRLTNLEYAPLAEIMGRVPWSSEVFNCSAPDTGNMEVLHMFGNEAQKEQWLKPLLNGEIRSAFAMTEPDVASSDATNIQTTITRDGDDYVINGRKWFITNAHHPNCKIFIVMGKTDFEAETYKQQSMVLVPMDTPGVELVRNITTINHHSPEGHSEVLFKDVRVPVSNLIANEGDGFMIAQARLGPGRIHHCMRLIGSAQRALEFACRRSVSRETFGRKLADHQSVLEDIAKSFGEIEQARLLTLKTARKIDEVGAKDARDLIAASKITVPLMAQTVIDRCMQIHGAGGLTADYPMAEAYNYARWCRQADGPDQVHMMALGKQIVRRYAG